MKLENKRIVITGATSGIGLHLTKTLAEIKGAQIIAVGRKIENIPIQYTRTIILCGIHEY